MTGVQPTSLTSPALELLFPGASWYSIAKALEIILRESWKGSIPLPIQKRTLGLFSRKCFLPGFTGIPCLESLSLLLYPAWDCPHPITPQQLMPHCCAPSVLIQLREHRPGKLWFRLRAAGGDLIHVCVELPSAKSDND